MEEETDDEVLLQACLQMEAQIAAAASQRASLVQVDAQHVIAMLGSDAPATPATHGGTRYLIDVLAQWGEEDGELWVASPFIDENITAINAFSSCAQERGKHVKIHIVTRRQSFSWIEICMLPIGFWFWIFQDCPGCSYSAPPALFCAALLHICQAGIKHCVGNQARQFHPLPIQQQKKQRNKAARTTHKEEHMLQQDNHNRSP